MACGLRGRLVDLQRCYSALKNIRGAHTRTLPPAGLSAPPVATCALDALCLFSPYLLMNSVLSPVFFLSCSSNCFTTTHHHAPTRTTVHHHAPPRTTMHYH